MVRALRSARRGWRSEEAAFEAKTAAGGAAEHPGAHVVDQHVLDVGNNMTSANDGHSLANKRASYPLAGRDDTHHTLAPLPPD